MENKYTLRYSGGLVPDVYQQFTKQQGVFRCVLIHSAPTHFPLQPYSTPPHRFSNPTSGSSPAKLRLAFEAAPFGLLVEMAGGKTSDGVTGGSVLDVKIDKVPPSPTP